MSTKKLLISFDESTKENNFGNFLIPVLENERLTFFGLKSRQIYSKGRLVYIGKEITEKDVFARLVDSGRKIDNVGKTLNDLEMYIREIGNFKIGDILEITAGNDGGIKLASEKN